MERNLLVGKLVIDSSVGGGAALNSGVLVVEVDLDNALAVDLAAGALANDFGGVENVLKDGILDGSEGAGARTGCMRPGGTLVGVAKDCALGNNEHKGAGELFLELANKLGVDRLERLEKLVGNVKDDGLLSTSAVNLLCGSDVEVLEGGLEIGGGHLQVEELGTNLGLELIGLLQDINSTTLKENE